ncbi:MAG: T9SS type A sorting domain-containing protein [Candidatus Delongbacteria bacterium]|nr:T9SS type A sorting domain-containing protein [Candidatus Delongbacteria bacterium]
MVKKLTVLSLALLIAVPLFSGTINDMKLRYGKHQTKASLNDKAMTAKTPYSGVICDPYFDKSANGYGWYQGYNRKVSWNADPATGSMIGSIYRRNNPATGSGTIGGMIGDWTGADLSATAQILYDVSTNWDPPQDPGGRYPYSCGFINGYFFGVFNDYNTTTGAASDAFPMYAVGDGTWGPSFSTWSVGLVDATDGGATVPGAWTGSGDTVFDTATGYYYWSQAWNQDLLGMDDFVLGCVVGRTQTPMVDDSWVWTDYSELNLDCADDVTGLTIMNDISWSYCKDIYGNGTGKGIAVTMANDIDDFVMVLDSIWTEVDSTTIPPDSAWVPSDTRIDLNPRISYMYTTNWGGDYASGDWSSNWIYDESHGDVRLFQLDPKSLFDWYGDVITEIDTVANDTLVTRMNDPFITWNISSVATEHDYVHLLVRVFGGSYDNGMSGYYMFDTDEDFVAGYYHIRGLITDTGVVWSPAHFIASFVGQDTFDIELVYSNFNVLAIGYAGFGQVYATWLDRPESRPTPNPWADGDTVYLDDGFLSFSGNDGDTWEIPAGGHHEVELDYNPGHIYNLYYAENVTNTGPLHEQGWTISSNGRISTVDTVPHQIEVYAMSQYYDAANPLAPPVTEFFDHQQFLHAWKITGTLTTGIETQNVSLDMDYELMQNYPNPFNPSTEISFKIENNANVKLTVFNSNGETVVRLADGKMEKGLHRVNFDATKLNSGVYFYQLDVNGMKSTKKMVLAK